MSVAVTKGAGNIAPLLIAGLIQLNIGAANTNAGVLNLITVTLGTRTTLPKGSQITMSGFSGASAASPLLLSDAPASTTLCGSGGCATLFSTNISGLPGYGLWDNTMKSLVIVLLNDSSTFNYVFSFLLTNPNYGQQPPSLFINVTGGQNVSTVPMTSNGTLKVIVILTKNISQSTPSVSATNTILVALALSTTFGEQQLQITIAGLTGAQAVSGPLVLADASFDTSCGQLRSCNLIFSSGVGAPMGYGLWNNNSKTLQLYTNINALSPASNFSTRFSFNVTNPPMGFPYAPNISIVISGTTVYGSVSQINGTMISGSGNKAVMLVAFFLVKNASQSTSKKGSINTINVVVEINVAIPISSILSVSGFLGSSTPSTTALATNGSNFANSARWFQGNGSILVSTALQIAAYTVYSFYFQLTNPLHGQYAPSLFIQLLSPYLSAFESVFNFAGTVLAPLFVADFVSVPTIKQLYPMENETNVISVVFVPNFNMSSSENSTIYLDGINIPLPGTVYLLPGLAANGIVAGVEGRDIFGTSKGVSTSRFQNGILSLQLFSSKSLLYNVSCAFSFNFTNPASDQQAPKINISALSSSLVVDAISMQYQHQLLLGVNNGSDPLTVVTPKFEVLYMNQSTPLPGAHENILTVQVQTNIELSGNNFIFAGNLLPAKPSSVVTFFGLYGAVASSSVPLLPVPGGNAAETLFSNGSASGQGLWNNGTLTLHVANGSNILSGVLYAFSFSVRNPPVAQSAPYVSAVAEGTAIIPLIGLTRPNLALLGIPNASNPLKIEAPLFLNKSMAQSYPFSGSLNMITVTICLNFDMYGSDNSVITLSNIRGAVAANYVQLSSVPNGNAGETLFSNGSTPGWGLWENGTLKLHVGPKAVISYKVVYAFSFAVTNPPYSQSAPSISIQASGTGTIPMGTVNTPNQMLMGVTNGSNPLEVLVPLFLNKSIVQSYPFSNQNNMITVQIALNFDLSGRDESSIIIAGFFGAIVDPSVSLLSSPGGNGGNLLFTNGTAASTGQWNNDTLTLRVDADAVVLHDVTYVFSFMVRNPPFVQQAPFVSIQASGTALTSLVGVVRPNSMLMGVTNGSNPLQVIIPLFLNKSIVQSYPFSNENNILTVAIATNFDLSGKDNSSITIVGLAGAISPPSVELLAEPGGNDGNLLFSNGTKVSYAFWNNGTLTLHLDTDAILLHTVVYLFSFIIRNPSYSQSAPYVSIQAIGTVPISQTGVVRPNQVLNGIANGTNPLIVVVPQFIVSTMNQSDPAINTINNLTFRFETNFDVLGNVISFRNNYIPARAPSVFVVSGLSGAAAGGSVLLMPVPGGNAAETLFSNGTSSGWGVWNNGTLTLYLRNESIILNGVQYALVFAVSNPPVAQFAPYISIAATGTATIPLVGLARPNLSLLGVVNGLNPLQIIQPTITNTSIAQTTPLISSYNVLCITMEINIDLAGSDGSQVTFSGLDGAVLGQPVPILIETVDVNDHKIFYSDVNGSWSNGTWSNSSVIVFLLPTHITLFSFTKYAFTFSIRNPPKVQKAPIIWASGSGTALFPKTLLNYTNGTRFGVSYGANPLFIIEVLWLIKFIVQSKPMSSVANTISVQIQPNCDLTYGSTITLNGLTQTSTTDTVLQLNDQPDGSINTSAAWNQENGSLVLKVLNLSAFSNLSFHFVLTNTNHDQNASKINISGVVNIPIYSSPIHSVYMDLSTGPLFGVAGGSSPLLTRVPRFYYAIMFQSNPASYVANTITFQFRINVNLNSSDFSNITISGFHGMNVPTKIVQLLPVFGGNSAQLLFGFDSRNQGNATFNADSVLYLQVFTGQTVYSETDYQFSFDIINPVPAQNAPPLTISAAGTAQYAPSLIQFLNTPRYGAPNGSNPLEIYETFFVKAAIAQSKPIAAYINTITVTIEMSLDLVEGSVFILSGFSPDAYPITNPSESPYKPLNLSNALIDFKFMPVDGGNSGEKLFDGFFDKGNISFVVLNNQTVLRNVEYRFSFQILNPNRAQNAPVISIEAHGVNGTSNFAKIRMVSPNQRLLGIANGTNVLKLIFEPLFQHILMKQSSPLSNEPNILTVLFSISIDLLGSDGSVITISGMKPSTVLLNPVNLSSSISNLNNSAASLFTYNSTVALAQWDGTNGSLYLHVDPNQNVMANINYELEFTVLNPGFEQFAPAISIAASGTADFFERAVDFVTYTIFGVINGSLPLFIIIPRFEIAYMEQDSTTANSTNHLTFIFRVNVELSYINFGSVTISGLSGAIEDSDVIPISNTSRQGYQSSPIYDASLKFQVKESPGQALWNSSILNGSLILKVGTSGNLFNVGNIVNVEVTYGFQFQVRNPPQGQVSPSISVEAFGGQNLHFKKMAITKGLGNLAPLLVAEFILKYIRQSSPLQGVMNTLTISLSCYANLLGTFNSSGTNIIINGLLGSNTSSQAVVLGGDAKSLNCSGFWNQQAGSLSILCFADIVALKIYNFSFQVLNPNSQQNAPSVTIATTGVVISPSLMVTGTNNERPLLIAGFLSGSIKQSTPSASVKNVLQFDFSTSLELKISDAVQITLEGLSGTKTFSFQVQVLSGPFGNSADWNFLSGVAVFSLNTSTPPRANVSVSFVVINSDGPRDPTVVTLKSYGLGSIVLSSIDDNTAPLRTAGVLQSFMNQSTVFQNTSNILQLIINLSCDLTVGTQLIIAGLSGISNPSGVIAVSSNPSLFVKIASWNFTVQTLAVAIANQTVKKQNYSLSFAIVNQMAGQNSPAISIFSTAIGGVSSAILINPVSVAKASGIFAPLLINGFIVNSIGQSTSRALVTNTITVSLSTYAPLPIGFQVTISGITTSDLVPRLSPIVGLSPNFSYFFNLSAMWSNGGYVMFSVLNETNENSIYVFSVNVTNPTHQYSPTIAISSQSISNTYMIKASGVGAPLQVILPLQLSPQCSNLSNWNLIAGNSTFSRRQGFGIAFNGGLELVGDSLFGKTGVWSQDTGTLVLELVDNLYAGQIYVFSFTLKNPSRPQNGSTTLTVNATGSATIGVQALQLDAQALNFPSSSPGDGIPLRVYGPAWALKTIQQSSPYPGAPNNITINISTFADLPAAGSCIVTLVGLSGTQTQTSASLPLMYPDSASASESIFGQSGSWDVSGVLSLQIAAGLTLRAGQSYAVIFQLVNPVSQRDAALVSIGASGSPSVAFALMDSLAGLSGPLFVLGAGFSVRRIGQSTPWPGAQNTITMTLASTAQWTSPLTVTLWNISGVIDSGAIVLTSNPPVFSRRALVDLGVGTLNFTLADGYLWTASEAVILNITLHNQLVAHDPPVVMISAAGSSTSFAPSEMLQDYVTILPLAGAVAGDARPFKVYAPCWTIKSITQSSPIAGAINTISASLSYNWPVSNSMYHGIMIKGLNAVINTLKTYSVSIFEMGKTNAIFYANRNVTILADIAYFDILQAFNQTIQPGMSVLLLFSLNNVIFALNGANLYIAWTATNSSKVSPLTVYVEMNANTNLILNILGAKAGDAVPLKVYGPAWALKTIQQSSPYPGAPNNITINISTFADLPAAGSCIVTLVGLSGTQTQTSASLPLMYPDSASASESIFGQSGSWDVSGVLSLQIAAGLTLRAGQSYAVIFQLVNPVSQRDAALVSIGASGSPSVAFALMDSLAGLSGPLFVLGAGFSVRRIGQSTPWPNVQNIVTCTLAATSSLQTGDVVLLFGLIGSSTSDTATLPISQVQMPGTNGALFLSSGRWTKQSGTLAVKIARSTMVGETMIFSFQLTNPSIGQLSPVPILSAVWPVSTGPVPIDSNSQGPWTIVPQALIPDANPPPGIPGAISGDAAPLRVYSPFFPIASIGQSKPFYGSSNVISVTLSANCNLTVSAGSKITLSGLSGSSTPNKQQLYLAGGFDGSLLYNDVYVSSDGVSWTQRSSNAAWTPREGHTLVAQNQTLYVIAGRALTAQTTQIYLADIWSSTDGIAWSQVLSPAPFPPRAFFAAVALGPLPENGLLVFGGSTNSPALRLNDVWRSNNGGLSWILVNASAQWAPRYGLAALLYQMPVLPADGLYSLYSDSFGVSAILIASGSTCSPGCTQFDLTLPGCNVLAGPELQCCTRTDKCAVYSNLADLWVSTDSGVTWAAMSLGAAVSYAPRAFPAAAVLPDGTVALATGYDYWDHFTADLQLFSINAFLGSSGKLTQSQAVPVAHGSTFLRRAAGQMVTINGCLLLLGGFSRLGSNTYTYYNDLWVNH